MEDAHTKTEGSPSSVERPGTEEGGGPQTPLATVFSPSASGGTEAQGRELPKAMGRGGGGRLLALGSVFSGGRRFGRYREDMGG